eukprot:358557-Chlamydomonas_euryale.AAC.1
MGGNPGCPPVGSARPQEAGRVGSGVGAEGPLCQGHLHQPCDLPARTIGVITPPATMASIMLPSLPPLGPQFAPRIPPLSSHPYNPHRRRHHHPSRHNGSFHRCALLPALPASPPPLAAASPSAPSVSSPILPPWHPPSSRPSRAARHGTPPAPRPAPPAARACGG